ncbi:MAG: hypothetical protein FJ109_00630 [Deltaproteobacteria bacterium]|nr:hypothetical protein [Deltaproteobacteria bacterium]
MRAVSLVAFVVVLAVIGTTSASVVRPFTLQELYSTAQLVVVGEVTGQTTFWNEAHDTIYTEYLVKPERVVKGEAPAEVRLRLMGGSLDGKTLTVPGNAPVEEGERVLLALRDQGSFQTLVGMSQGKWSLRSVDGKDRAWRGPRLQAFEPLRDGEVLLDDLLDDMQRNPGRMP